MEGDGVPGRLGRVDLHAVAQLDGDAGELSSYSDLDAFTLDDFHHGHDLVN